MERWPLISTRYGRRMAINWAQQGFRKSSRSGAGNDCVYLNGDRSRVADSKSDRVLAVPAAALVALARLR